MVAAVSLPICDVCTGMCMSRCDNTFLLLLALVWVVLLLVWYGLSFNWVCYSGSLLLISVGPLHACNGEIIWWVYVVGPCLTRRRVQL